MPIKDQELVERLTEALRNDPRTADLAIEVLSDGGLVTLRGTVPSEDDRQAAEEVVRGREDVISIVSDLEVDETADDEYVPPIIPHAQ